ncbi:MAG: hypothetical protein WBW57_10385 [Candidatus Sulfotelmatobacter sp.]
MCKQTLPLDLPRLLLVNIEQTFVVLTAPASQELPSHVIDLDEIAPLAR